jgi:hypothetical protein
MLVKNMRDDIWVKSMSKNALGHLDLCILPVRPLPQKFVYSDICEVLGLLLRKNEKIRTYVR